MSRTRTSSPRSRRARASAATWTATPPYGGGQSPTSAILMPSSRRSLGLGLRLVGAVGPLPRHGALPPERPEDAVQVAGGEGGAVARRPLRAVLPDRLPLQRVRVAAAAVLHVLRRHAGDEPAARHLLADARRVVAVRIGEVARRLPQVLGDLLAAAAQLRPRPRERHVRE